MMAGTVIKHHFLVVATSLVTSDATFVPRFFSCVGGWYDADGIQAKISLFQ